MNCYFAAVNPEFHTTLYIYIASPISAMVKSNLIAIKFGTAGTMTAEARRPNWV